MRDQDDEKKSEPKLAEIFSSAPVSPFASSCSSISMSEDDSHILALLRHNQAIADLEGDKTRRQRRKRETTKLSSPSKIRL